jgi:DNA-binding MarR family transcriptional regulator
MAQVNPPLMTADEQSAAAALRVTIARIYRALRLSTTAGITPSQVSVLFRVEQSEPVRMGVLAHLERITPATLSKVIDSLETLELVEREPDPFDGRVTLIRVSATGRRLIETQRAATTHALEVALAKMDRAQRELLLESLPALEGLAEILLARSEES